MNWFAIFGAGLLAGATTCAVAQGGLLVGLINRQKRAADEAAVGAVAVDTRSSVAEDLVPVGGFLVGKFVILVVVGVLLGALGSFFAIDARIGGFAQLLAAAVMIMLGLGAAGVAGFRDIRFTPPESWTRVVRKSTRSQSAFAPFLLGLATVLIPCGVTISIMLLAATAGSAAAGGAVMGVFVLGTVPMFAAYGLLAQRYVSPDNRAMSVILGVVIVLMGLVTLNASLTALGSSVTAQTVAASVMGSRSGPASTAAAPTPVNGVQVLRIDARSDGYSPQVILAKAGVPTKVVFHTDHTRSCIVDTVFPSLGKQVVLPDSGDTEIDLGTLAAGDIPISCSMGMYSGTITVS